MRVVELVRLEEYQEGTLGILKIDKEFFCCTLEPNDLENKKGNSSIPAQQYVCERFHSEKHPNTFQVLNVPDRTAILFHPGNTTEDTEGCILLGQYPGKLKYNRAVLNSGNTFHRFMASIGEENKFSLTIREVY